MRPPGCVGCHENRRTSAAYAGGPLALEREPSRIQPWYGPPRKFNYLVEVQPAFDRHCVSCHDYGKEAGEKLNLAGDLGLVFNVSYFELRTKGFVNVPGAGPHTLLPPKSWGSHVSRLAEVLLQGHGEAEIDRQVQLDKEGFDRVITWIDINAPYYPEYASAYRDNLYGRSALRAAQLDKLSRLTGMNLSDRRLLSQVSFTRPEVSPCLAKLADKSGSRYQEALAIIQAGSESLAQRPRAEMPDFRLVSQQEINQQAKYEARVKLESDMRRAIAAGRKKYEKGQP